MRFVSGLIIIGLAVAAAALWLHEFEISWWPW